MSELLKGSISNALGLRDALEQVTAMRQINSGVLAISGGQVGGRMGIAWGRFITGAILDSGERGRSAARQLLAAKAGDFLFSDTDGEPVDELRQSLGIDLNGVVPYVPDELSLMVTPWLFDPGEQGSSVTAAPITPAVALAPAAAKTEAEGPVEEKADRVLAQLQRVVGETQSSSAPSRSPVSDLEKQLPPGVIELITTSQSSIVEEPVDRTRDMEPLPARQWRPAPFIPDAARATPIPDGGLRGQRQRAANHQGRDGRDGRDGTDGGDTVGIAILCVLFFVVSCAGTVIFGPRIAAVVTSAFHASH